MRITAATATHTGHLRPANEDSVFAGNAVYAVADGLGGHAAGEVASALAIEPLAALDRDRAASPDEPAAALSDAVRDANRRVAEDARANPEHAGMGTTLTAAMVSEDQLAVAHVGDTRAYLLREGDGLSRLTEDHNPVANSHVLTRVVGVETDIDVDVPPLVSLQVGDRLLLCSDGLTEVVDDDGIAATLGTHTDPQQVCDALVAAALDRGGPDNVTVVAMFVGK